MLNHKFQITNHSPSPDGLGPALLKKGGGSKQYAYSAEKKEKGFGHLNFSNLNLFRIWNLEFRIYLVLGIWCLEFI